MTLLRKATISLAALALLVAAAPGRIEATPLLPGTTLNSLTAVAPNPGTLLQVMTVPFSTTGGCCGSVTGFLTSAVYRNASGALDFYYQAVNTSPGTPQSNPNLGISGIGAFNFGSFTTSVNYVTTAFGVFSSGGTKPPLSAKRGASPNNPANGSIVTFFFGPPFGSNKVYQGQTSNILLVSTNARGYTTGNGFIQNSGTATPAAFVVPEPASATIAVLGLLGLAGIRRRQRRA